MTSSKWAFGWLFATSLFACTQPQSGYAPARGSTEQAAQMAQAASSNDRLSSAEWQTFKADQLYVNNLVKPDTRVRLNYADPRQYRFVMARLKLAGKNEKNSPYLFELLAGLRKQQLASGLAAGKIAEVILDADPTVRGERHEVTIADPGKPARINVAAAEPGVGAVTSTFPGGSYYTFVDVLYGTATGEPLAPYTYHEEWEDEVASQLVGADISVRTVANTSASAERAWLIGTYKVEDSEAGFSDSYKRVSFALPTAAPTPAALELERIQINEPIDHNNDGKVHLCFNRGSDVDCDTRVVPPDPGAQWELRVPLVGSLAIHSRHKFSAAAIQDVKSKLAAGQYSENAGFISLYLTQHGGGCAPEPANVSRLAYMNVFWKTVSLTGNDQILSWNLSGNDEGLFDGSCAIHDAAALRMRIPLPIVDPEDPAQDIEMSFLTVSTDPRDLPPDPNGNENGRVKPIFITNSCVAAGTLVRVAEEQQVAIESLQIGQAVYSPYDRADHQLDITDVSKGVEPIAMVRLRDEAGRTLLLTEMHPLATPDRGMVQARALRAGDLVMTEAGPSKLTEASREAYGGKVYNLKVGSPAEMAQLSKDQTVFYANGFVVGDEQLQRHYEDLSTRQENTTTAAEIPPQWRRDYQLAKQRQR